MKNTNIHNIFKNIFFNDFYAAKYFFFSSFSTWNIYLQKVNAYENLTLRPFENSMPINL